MEAWSSPEARVAGGSVPACLDRTTVWQKAGKGSGRRCLPGEEDAFRTRLHNARLGADLAPLQDRGAGLWATSGSSRGTWPRVMLPQCPLLSDLLIAFRSVYCCLWVCQASRGCARPHVDVPGLTWVCEASRVCVWVCGGGWACQISTQTLRPQMPGP